MATTLYLRQSDSSVLSHLAGDPSGVPQLSGGGVLGTNMRLFDTAGTGLGASLYRTTVGSDTTGLELQYNGVSNAVFMSAPLAADATISGSITFNLWAYESSMSANAAINARLFRVAYDTGVYSEIIKTTRATELGTSSAAANWSEAPGTSQAVYKGDRIALVVFTSNVGTMGDGYTVTCDYGAASGSAGYSYITLNETLSFASSSGGGTTVFPKYATGSAGMNAPGRGFSNPQGSYPDWTSAGSVTSSDNAYAQVTCDSSGYSDMLDIDTFGFSIPATAIITGIEVEIEGKASAANCLLSAKLLYAADTATTGSALRTLGTTDGTATVGSSTSLWSYASWTAAKINSSAFGVRLYAGGQPINASETLYVDYVRVKVYYELYEAWSGTPTGTGIEAVTSVPSSGWAQATGSSGGSYVEWYTRPLQATTLAGVAAATVYGLESSSSANVQHGLEIARVNGDGSSPTVWGRNGAGQEMTISTTSKMFWVTGADLAISDGQRLRFRFLIGGNVVGISPSWPSSAYTATVYYDATDTTTAVSLPITLTEYGGATTYNGSFAADAVVKRLDIPGTFSANAVIKKIDIPGSFTADAVIGAATTTYNGSFAADAVIKRLDIGGSVAANATIKTLDIPGTFSANAAIKRLDIPGSFAANAAIGRVFPGTIAADAAIGRVFPGTFSADAAIKRLDIPGSISANAAIGRIYTSTIDANAAIGKTTNATVAADAVIKKIDIPGTFAANAAVQRVFPGTVAADAVIQSTLAGTVSADATIAKLDIPGSFLSDAVIQNTLNGSFTVDAEISSASVTTVNGSFTADAAIAKLDITGSLAVNAVIKTTVNGTIAVNAAILRTWWFGDQAAGF